MKNLSNLQLNESISIKDLPDSDQQAIRLMLENPIPCSLCGCEGLHACLGYKVVWTEEDKLRLNQALSKMFGWENK